MADIRLIAVDLDGTLMGRMEDFPLYTVYRDKLADLQLHQGTLWAVCTGRSLRSFKTFFEPMQAMGVMPDYVIIEHAYAYSVTRFGYVPHVLWNLRIRYLMWLMRVEIRDAIAEWFERIRRMTHRLRVVRRTRDRLWIRLENEEVCHAVAEMLAPLVARYPNLRLFRFLQEIDIRSVPFTKGLAVSELARHLHIEPAAVLSIGDGHNDISMLDGKVAGMTGCPANAEPEVVEVVHRGGGHIAKAKTLAGVLEILDAQMAGRVQSDLPADWKDPSSLQNPNHKAPKPSHKETRALRAMIIFLGTAYVGLLVFAKHGVIPGMLGRLILIPYKPVEKVLYTVLNFIWRW